MLAVAAWSRAWVLDLLGEIVESLLARANGGEPRTEVKDIVTEYDNGVQMYMIAVAQGYDGDPWYRLAMLVAMAREGMTFFKSHGELLYGAAEESRPKAAELIEKQLRTFVDADLLNCFVETVVEADRDLQDPSRTRDRRLTGRLRRHPLASPRKLFAAVGILFELSARSGVTLTEEQWTALAGVLDRVGTPQMTLGALLDFQMSESGALSRSLRGGVPGLPYLKGRIKTIEQTMARPMLTTSERAVLSSWLWLLVTWYRPFVGDFCSLPQEQALWFLERLGSSAYRADTFWFARVRALPPPRFERPTEEHMGKVRFEDPEPSPDSPEALWGTFHVAREHLDLWGRYRMAEEGRRINPAVEFVFKQTLADPTEQVIAAPLDANPDDLERLTGVPRERWQRTDSAILIRQTPRTHSEMCALVDGARRVIGAVTRYLAGNGELPDDETIPDVDGASLRAALAANPARAVVFMGAYPGTPAPLLVFHARNGELVRHTIGALEGASPEEISVHGDALRSSFELTGALDDDRREPTALSWKNLGETLERVRISYAPWSRELAAVLAREALTDVLLVTRGITSALVPWEDMPADDSGATLGERFTISHTHTLAALPAPASAARAGAVQIYGDGRSREQMMPAASLMRSLSSVSVAREPLSGADACDGPALYEALRSASRLRFFLHGSHDRNRPHADRLTLIDGAGPQERVDLNPDNIRVLPLGGMRCVELWACEGAAYGRHLMEHGTAEEPEDLTTAFLHAGAQRVLAPRWHVPALPSALLMERVALLVHAGVDEARALADAQSELRAAFAPRGPVERDVVAAAAPLLRELGARGGSSIEGESRAILEEVLDEKIHELRVSWYDAASLEPPQGRIRWGEQRLGRLVRFVPPRSERLANALRETPDIWAAEATASFLAPLQSPACWAGWKVTLRSFDAWGA
ncbi:MAG TPA: CHAT domain-containing protein [Polyangiaceae bacterium]|nr:CHAT domain-containing protein [Polyangiaceae bacterium]